MDKEALLTTVIQHMPAGSDPNRALALTTAILALQSSERGVERMFVLEWIAAPRPPVHPEPMRGRREFPSIEKVAEFVNNLPDDAEIDSLIEHATAKINRTAELNAATLSPAEPSPESREDFYANLYARSCGDVLRVRAETIEECAKVAEATTDDPPESMYEHAYDHAAHHIAAQIRALSAPAHD